MSIMASLVIGLIAVLHIYIMWFEMFAWTTRGPKVFKGFPKEVFEPTVPMAANQGLYNGFLAAGLIWSMLITSVEWSTNIATFFLLCVAVAGVYGAKTASKQILYVQTVPAVLALILLYI